MQTQVSVAEWLKNAPPSIPVEKLREIRDSTAAELKREREKVLRRAAELEADLKALSEEPAEPQTTTTEPEESVVTQKPNITEEAKPTADWSNKAIVLYFAKKNPGAKSEAFIRFLMSFRPNTPEKTTRSNVYDALKKLKRDGVIKSNGPRAGLRHYYAGDQKTRP